MSEEAVFVSRREFGVLSLAAALGSRAQAAAIEDTDVAIPTADGTCDAALVRPRGNGPYPACILFTDVFGLRPTMRQIAARLAAGSGYAVLVPNPYYRSSKAPGLSITLNFQNPADRDKMNKIRAPLTAEAIGSDTAAYVKWLDSQAVVNKKLKMRVFGYCMGGSFTLLAAASNPDRVGAGASFHGGGLVTDKPDSPHLQVTKIKAEFYFAVADNDDKRQPDAKIQLEEAFKKAHLKARVEVYDGCAHGWCVTDMPLQDGKPIYDAVGAERAWGELVSSFGNAHV